MKFFCLTTLLLVGVSLTLGSPPPPKGKDDHKKDDKGHPGVHPDEHFKDGAHDPEYDRKAFLDKENAEQIPEDDDDDDGELGDNYGYDDGEKYNDDYNYNYNDDYNDTMDDYNYDYNDTMDDYNYDYNDTAYNDYDNDYNDTVGDYDDYPKNGGDYGDEYQGDDDGDGYDDNNEYGDDDNEYAGDEGDGDNDDDDNDNNGEYDNNDETVNNGEYDNGEGGDDNSDIKEPYKAATYNTKANVNEKERTKRDVDQVEGSEDTLDHSELEGSEDEADEYKELSETEAKSKLQTLAKRMDKNKDDHVDKEELTDWISHSFRMLDETDAKKQFDRQDKDKNGSITWTELLQEVYGYTPEEVAQHENETSDEMKNFVQMTKDDKRKFDLADEDKDGVLDFKEFMAYHNPHNFKRMAPVEIEKTMREYDKNKDGKITYNEYTQKDDKKDDLKDEDEDEDETELKKQFMGYDKNNDTFLDHGEVEGWVIPPMDELAVEESNHLLKEADKNQDGKLSMDEIRDAHELFVGSQATDYGDVLHKIKEEL